MAFDSYYVREEDGTSHYLLEDGTGALILETAVEITTTTHAPAGRHFRIDRPLEDEDGITAALTLLL